MSSPTPTVAGESLDDLVAVLSNVRFGDEVDGLTDVDLRLNDEESAIFRRALMRLEAELLLDDADALDAASVATMRTPPQRRHDAFMLLVERIIEAAGAQG